MNSKALPRNLLSILTVICMLAGHCPAPVTPALAEDTTADYTANVLLTFEDSQITAQGTSGGYEISGTTLTITSAGTYGITGSCSEGSIVVSKGVTDVVLILKDLTLSASSTAPLVCKGSSGVTLFATGTVTLTDLETDESSSDYEGAAIKVKSAASLTIEGDGTLKVVNSVKNGIKGAATATITVAMNSAGGVLNVNAANNGIASDGQVLIKSGTLSVTADNEGIKSEPEEDDTSSAGTIGITGGSITVNAGSDGIQAVGGITISGGTLNITADSDCIHSKSDMTISGGSFTLKTLGQNSDSSKGIKASVSDDTTENSTITLTITSGSFSINTVDDAVHSDGYIVITGGSFDITTGDDGVHADTSLTLGKSSGKDRDPYIRVNSSYEGLEAGNLYIYSGKYYVSASDDGINAAGGSSSGTDAGGGTGNHFNPGGGPGGFGGTTTSTGSYSLNIYGGHVYVLAGGDGLDSNGALNLTGGDIEVWAQSSGDNEPMDYDGTLTVNGATVLAAGCVGMGQARPSGGQTYKNYSTSVSKGTVVSILSGSTTLFNAEAPKSASYVFFSSPSMTSSATLSTSASSVDCSAGGSFSHTWSGTTCTVCGATETVSGIANSATSVSKTAVIDVTTVGACQATFTAENATINVYTTDSAETPDETNVTSAYARTDGEIDVNGTGSIRFQAVPADGYQISCINVDGTYTELLGWDDTGEKNVYEITNVSSDLTVEVVTVSETEAGYTVTFAAGDNPEGSSFTITNYYTHNYDEEDASTYAAEVTSAVARNDLTGGVDISGSGQVNFRVVPAEGWYPVVTAEGDYKNLKTPSDTGETYVYRLTKVTGAVTVTVTLTDTPPDGYPVTFVHEGSTVNIYYAQSYETADEEDVDTAYSRDGDTGEADGTGSGQVNFTVIPDSGYVLEDITVDGEYKNLKDVSEDAGVANTYRITKIAGELTVTILVTEDTTPILSLYQGQTVTLPDCASVTEATTGTVISISGAEITALAAGSTEISVTDSDGTATTYYVNVYEDVSVLVLPESLTEIDEEAFAGDESLQFAELDEAVASIGANAFQDSGLLQIEIDAATVTIDATAFDGTTPTIICAEGSSAETFAIQYGLPYVYDD